MDREEYTQKMKLIQGDADKYWIIQCDPTLKIEKKISESLKHLQKEGYIDDRLCDFLFMEDLKDQAMHSSPLQPSLWLRYVDDAFVIWPRGEQNLQSFHAHLNQMPANIDTIEKEEEGRLAFLDVMVTRSQDQLYIHCGVQETNQWISTSRTIPTTIPEC